MPDDLIKRLSRLNEELRVLTEFTQQAQLGKNEQELISQIVGNKRSGDKIPLELYQLVRVIGLGVATGGGNPRLLYRTGYSVGRELPVKKIDDIRDLFEKWGFGEVKIHRPRDGKDLFFSFTDCPTSRHILLTDKNLCAFEAGLLAGMLGRVSDTAYRVEEEGCQAQGQGECLFRARERKPAKAAIEDENVYKTDYAEENIQLLSTLTNHAATALENALLYEQTRKMVITDSLTFTYNRRYFQSRLREEVARAERHNQNLALLMLDVDDFKKINDTYGHPQGDLVLKKTAQVVKDNVREIDVICRYGGDEFCLILPQTNQHGVETVAQRILRDLEKLRLGTARKTKRLRVSASIGAAIYPEDARSVEELINRADSALYMAKRSGRQKFIFYC